MNLNTSDNVYFYSEQFSKFMERKPEIPSCQRSYIDERITQFYDRLIKFHTDGKIPYIGVIHCASFNNFYIVDGQHRFYAYKKYYETFKKDFNIHFIVKVCSTKEQVSYFFRELNDSYNLHDIILNDFDKAEIVKNHIRNKYGKHVSNSESPKYPNINIDQLTKYIIETFKNSSSIIEKFEELNRDVFEYIKEDEKYNKSKQGLYLAYLFIKTERESKRIKINKTVRHSLWENKFGDTLKGFCDVCNCEIGISNFHAGHITSVKDGGTNNISNLVPVCSLCNLSMGTQNLNDFKKKYF